MPSGNGGGVIAGEDGRMGDGVQSGLEDNACEILSLPRPVWMRFDGGAIAGEGAGLRAPPGGGAGITLRCPLHGPPPFLLSQGASGLESDMSGMSGRDQCPRCLEEINVRASGGAMKTADYSLIIEKLRLKTIDFYIIMLIKIIY